MITGPEPGLTRDAVATDFAWGGRPVRLFDTAGLRRKARISEEAEKLAASDAVRAIRFAEVVVLLVDAEHPFEHQDLTIGDLVDRGGPRAGHRRQQVGPRHRQAEEAQGAARDASDERLAQVPGVPLVAISALAGSGLDKLMTAVLAAYEIWNRRVPTPQLNRWLAEALERHAPPASKGRRVKIRFMTQPSARPPTFVAFCSRPEALPQGLSALSHQQPARGLRSAGRADPLQAAQGRQPVRRASADAPLRRPPVCCGAHTSSDPGTTVARPALPRQQMNGNATE